MVCNVPCMYYFFTTLVFHEIVFYSTNSSFKENDGNNGIFIIAYTPLLFGGTTRFIGNRGSDALRVYILCLWIALR